MFPSPARPRARQSGLWQNCSCGSIGDPPGARSGDHARRDAGWTRAFQAQTILITVPWGATILRNSDGNPWTKDAINCAFCRLRVRLAEHLMDREGLPRPTLPDHI